MQDCAAERTLHKRYVEIMLPVYCKERTGLLKKLLLGSSVNCEIVESCFYRMRHISVAWFNTNLKVSGAIPSALQRPSWNDVRIRRHELVHWLRLLS